MSLDFMQAMERASTCPLVLDQNQSCFKMRFYWIVAAFLPWLVPGKKQKTVVVRLTDGQPDSTKKEKARLFIC